MVTGCRGVEVHGSKRYGYKPLEVGDVDLEAGRIVLRDTKNRSGHKLLLSRQALELAKAYCKDRKLDAPLFSIVDARKTLARINSEAGTTVQGHGLRATFASIAQELVSGGVLKRMMNHAAGGDVTLGHYVGKGRLSCGRDGRRSRISLSPWPSHQPVCPKAALIAMLQKSKQSIATLALHKGDGFATGPRQRDRVATWAAVGDGFVKHQ